MLLTLLLLLLLFLLLLPAPLIAILQHQRIVVRIVTVLPADLQEGGVGRNPTSFGTWHR